MQEKFHLQVYSVAMAEEGLLIQFSLRTADSPGDVKMVPKSMQIFFFNKLSTVSIICSNLAQMPSPDYSRHASPLGFVHNIWPSAVISHFIYLQQDTFREWSEHHDCRYQPSTLKLFGTRKNKDPNISAKNQVSILPPEKQKNLSFWETGQKPYAGM